MKTQAAVGLDAIRAMTGPELEAAWWASLDRESSYRWEEDVMAEVRFRLAVHSEQQRRAFDAELKAAARIDRACGVCGGELAPSGESWAVCVSCDSAHCAEAR